MERLPFKSPVSDDIRGNKEVDNANQKLGKSSGRIDYYVSRSDARIKQKHQEKTPDFVRVVLTYHKISDIYKTRTEAINSALQSLSLS